MKKEKITRDQLKQNLFKKKLEEESIRLYGDIRCYASRKPYKGLIASHIKPYKICVLEADQEAQFDINNGLLLCKAIDDYFDKFLLTFDREGKIIFSDEIPEEIIADFSTYYLDEKVFNQERQAYMNIHRCLFLYKHYYSVDHVSSKENGRNTPVPYFDCGIKILNGQCIINEDGRWEVCSSRKIKAPFIERTGYDFKYSNADLLGKLMQNESYVLEKLPLGLHQLRNGMLLIQKVQRFG